MSERIHRIEDFLTLLKGVKPTSKDHWMAFCPSHDDRHQSLSIALDHDKILAYCHAGCSLEQVLAPLRLKKADLFLNNRKPKSKRRESREIEAVYGYADADGKPFEVVRYKPKGFSQRRPNGKGGYIWNLEGITPTLYHKKEVEAAITRNETIYLVEGEKDVDNLRSRKFVATTNVGGAGKWRGYYTEALRGADLVIIPDNDEPGRAHANLVAGSCFGVASQIRIVELPDGSKDVSDWFTSGGDVEKLRELTSKCPVYKPLPKVVVTGRQLRDVTSEALKNLYRDNKPPRIFRRGGTLIRVTQDEKGRPFTEMLTESALRGYLARCCDFLRATARNGMTAVAPPLDVVRDIISLEGLDFPALESITEAPLLRSDGSVISQPGYDIFTRLYYHPSPDLSIPSIPERPTDDQISHAMALVAEPLSDFPFDSEASRANAIATMFTPILRPMIDGPVPLAIIDKPQAGTGASLLAEVITLIATGRPAAMMTAQKDDEGWRKAITSLLLKGQLVVTIDNVESTLFAPSLAAILTATTYQDRLLGRSEMVTLPNRTTWIATGNNIRLGGDLPRRSMWIRMDAKMARPWLRDAGSFRHPHLLDWVAHNRSNLLSAMLTIVRAWAVSGMPKSERIPNLGGYESYCRVIGSVLAYMGVVGFLENLDAMYNETDTETPQWQCFLEAWHETIGGKAITAAELASKLSDHQEIHATLPDAISDTDSRNYSVRLGQKLSRKNGVRYPNGLVLIKAGERRRAVTWRVVRFENETAPQFSFKGEVGEVQTTPARIENREEIVKNPYEVGADTTSPNLTSGSEKGEVCQDEVPDYPNQVCASCGCGDYRLTDSNQWVCSQCHPISGMLQSRKGESQFAE
jgi:hypothetical protein